MARKTLLAALFILLVGLFFGRATSVYLVQLDGIKKQITKVDLPLSMDDIYGDMRSALKSPIFISSLMAGDVFIKDWISSGEVEPEPMIRYLSDIQRRYKTLSAFLVSDATKLYYHPTGLRQTVSEDREEDAWFFRVKNLDKPYEVNIDFDYQSSDLLTIFINYRVLNFEGEFIGAAGVGVEVDAAHDFIEHSAKRYKHDVYFLDPKGAVRLTGSKTQRRFANLYDFDPLKSVAKFLLDGSMNAYSFKQNGNTHYVLARYVPDFNWIILVEKSDGEMQSDVFRAYMIEVMFGLLLIVIAVLYVKTDSD